MGYIRGTGQTCIAEMNHSSHKQKKKCTGCTSSAEPREGFILNIMFTNSKQFLQNIEAVTP